MKNLLIGAALCTALANFAMDRDIPNAPSPQPLELIEGLHQQSREYTDTENGAPLGSFVSELDYSPRHLAGQRSSPIMSTEEFYEALKNDSSSETNSKNDVKAEINFFQKTALINTFLQIHIQNKDFEAVQQIMAALRSYGSFNMADIIEEETLQEAERIYESEERLPKKAHFVGKPVEDLRPAQIYDLLLEQLLPCNNPSEDSSENYDKDTANKALNKILAPQSLKALEKSNSAGQRAIILNEVLLTCIKNLDQEWLNETLSAYDEQKNENLIYEDTIAQASSARAQYKKLYLLFDPCQARKQYEKSRTIHRRLKKYEEYMHDFFSSDSDIDLVASRSTDSTECDYEFNKLWTAVITHHIKTALSGPALELVVGPARAERILQILEEERIKKK